MIDSAQSIDCDYKMWLCLGCAKVHDH